MITSFLNQIPLSDIQLLVIEVICILLFGFLLHQQRASIKRKQQYAQLAQQQLREETLDRRIQNPISQTSTSPTQNAQKPYEVSYKELPKTSDLLHYDISQNQNIRHLELIVDNSSSTQKFLCDYDLTISIGRRNGNSIVVESPKVSAQHCKLFMASGKIYLKDLGSKNGTFLIRPPATSILFWAKARTRVKDKPIQVLNHDVIRVADVKVEVVFL